MAVFHEILAASTRILPFKYLSRLLDALGLKAIIVRPSLDGWNSISQTHTLEQMLLEIGEPFCNYAVLRRLFLKFHHLLD